MDPYRNPFAPGAGSRPPELAGRDAILEAARISCGRAIKGRSARSILLLGLRGTGKVTAHPPCVVLGVALVVCGWIVCGKKVLARRLRA